MPDRDDRFSKVYWRLAVEYPDIWTSPELLGTYVQLLAVADATWPTPAPLPVSAVNDGHSESHLAFGALVDVGLIETDGRTYRVRGMTADRARRRGHMGGIARAARATRDDAGRFAGDDVAGPDAGRSNGNAGPDAGPVAGPSNGASSVVAVLDRPATPATLDPANSSHREGEREDDGPLLRREAVVPPVGRNARTRDDRWPPDDCTEPEAHRLVHRWVAGLDVWRCPTCEARKRPDEPSLADRVGWKPAPAGDDRPF